MAYPRPPITEAVIELRFAKAFEKKLIEAAAKRLRSDYFYQDPEEMLEFTIDANQVARRTAALGLKLSSLDRADVLMLRTSSYVCSRLAPYPGWDGFIARAKRGWTEWKKAAGTVELSRIGVRYVNRIDVPTGTDTAIRVEDYLNFGPRLPAGLTEPMATFAMQAVVPFEGGRYMVVMNSSIIPSPLVGFASFVLDLDVGRDKELPRRDDDLWSVLDEMREHKNRVFEYCVTDTARGLFS